MAPLSTPAPTAPGSLHDLPAPLTPPQRQRGPLGAAPPAELRNRRGWLGGGPQTGEGRRGRVLRQPPPPGLGRPGATLVGTSFQGRRSSFSPSRRSQDRDVWLPRWGRGWKTPKLSASALRGALLGEDQAGISDQTLLGSRVLGWASPLPPRPAPHLLRRLGVKVRLQQRDRELDLPGAVVRLHGWAVAAGPRCGGDGGGTRGWGGRAPSPLRSAPLRPGPSRARSAPAPGSALPARGLRDSAAAYWLRTAPPQPPPSPRPLALTPSWLRRWLRGSPPRGRASEVWPAPVPADSPGAGAGVPGVLGREGRGWRAAAENFSRPGRFSGWGAGGALRKRRQQTRKISLPFVEKGGCLLRKEGKGT